MVAEYFSLILDKGLVTNVFGGPILHNYDWQPLTSLPPMGGPTQYVPAAIPGHPETIVVYGRVDGVYQPFTVDQAIERIGETNAILESWGMPTYTPEQQWDAQLAIFNQMPVGLVGCP